MALTDIAIRKARPRDKTQRLFDAGGPYLGIAPSGGTWWRLPLSTQALAMLTQAEACGDRSDLPLPSPFHPGEPLNDGTFNSALVRPGYKGRTTAHGFRTVFSTAANEAGWRADVIERHLAHEDRDPVRAACNRAQWLEERHGLMQWWADSIDAWRKK